MKKLHTLSGFSIVLAMGLVLIFSFIGIYLLEYMVPFSRNIKGIENSSQAFYESYAGIEETIMLSYSGAVGENYSKSYGANFQDYKYSFTGSSLIIPTAGGGNSFQNPNFSILSQSNSVSIPVGNNILGGGTNNLSLTLGVPDFDNDSYRDSLGNYNDILLWQISGQDGSLSAQDLGDINPISKELIMDLYTQRGLELQDSVSSSGILFSTFYTNNCLSDACMLRLSIVDTISSPSGGIYPYLEYQISSNDLIPDPHPIAVSTGKSYGFSKQLEVRVPIPTTSSAFDFTIIQ